MNFAEPSAFYWAAAALLLAAGLAAFGLRRRDALLARFAAPRLLESLTERAGPARTVFKTAFFLLAVLAAGLALTRPQYGIEFVERKARGLDIVFALDVSRSMLADDLRPSRLERAKFAVLDLIERLESDRVGLVAFAGEAFLQCPPTLDYAAFRESLDAAGPGALTRGGSDLGAAIREAAEAFPAENNVKVVVLLTDGEDLAGGATEAAAEAAEAGITVHAVGIGTPSGVYLRAPGPDGEGEYIRDDNGQPVLSRLDEATLQAVAARTGGRYSRLGDGSLETLYGSVLSALPRGERDSELREVPVERFQWPLGAALAFLVVEMLIRRRRTSAPALALAFALFSAIPQPASAQTAPVTEDAVEVLTQREAGRETGPADPRELYNEGVKRLRAGEFAAARDALERAVRNSSDIELQRDALYNLGHAGNQLADAALGTDPVAALEHLRESERHFAAAAEIDPTDAAAAKAAERMTRRREAVEKWLEQQDQQQQQNQDQQGGQQQDQQQQNQGQQQQGGQQQQQQDGESREDDSSDRSDQSDQSDQGGEDSGTGDRQQGGEQEEQQQQGGQDQESGSQDRQEGDQGSQQDDPSDRTEPKDETAGQAQAAAEDAAQDADQNRGEQPEGGGAAAATAVETEGMSEEEARALLEALRGSERLLPFGEPSGGTPGRKGEERDW